MWEFQRRSISRISLFFSNKTRKTSLQNIDSQMKNARRLEKAGCTEKQEENCSLSTTAINARVSPRRTRGKNRCNCSKTPSYTLQLQKAAAIKCHRTRLISLQASIIGHRLWIETTWHARKNKKKKRNRKKIKQEKFIMHSERQENTAKTQKKWESRDGERDAKCVGREREPVGSTCARCSMKSAIR